MDVLVGPSWTLPTFMNQTSPACRIYSQSHRKTEISILPSLSSSRTSETRRATISPCYKNNQQFTSSECDFLGKSEEDEQAEKLRNEVLRATIPLHIYLDQREIASLRHPPPLFLSASRLAYLPQLLDLAREHFDSVLPSSYGQQCEPWVDFEGIPMDYRLPLGVLIDLHVGIDPVLPVCFTVHFLTPLGSRTDSADSPLGETTGSPPGDNLTKLSSLQGLTNRHRSVPEAMKSLPLPYRGWSGFQAHFLSLLRQASFLLQGNARPFQSLSKANQLLLYEAVRGCDLSKFNSIRRIVINVSSPASIKLLPVLLHVFGPPYLQLQRAVPPLTSNGAAVRVGDFLLEVLPSFCHTRLYVRLGDGEPPTYFERKKLFSTLRPFEAESTPCLKEEDQHLAEFSCIGVSEESISKRTEDHKEEDLLNDEDIHVLVHGVEVPLDAPLWWLTLNAYHLDGFLHIIVRLSSEYVLAN